MTAGTLAAAGDGDAALAAGPELLALARRCPERALQATAARLTDGHITDSERAGLHHAAGLARLERGELAAAADELAAVPQRGSRSGDIALTRAWIEFQRGAPQACVAVVNAALADLDHLDHLDEGQRAWARALRGNALRFLGKPEPASADLDAAVSELSRVSARREVDSWLAAAHNLRAAARLEWGELAGADADFAVAARLFAAQRIPERAAGAAHNRGCVALRRGDPRAALRCFGEAERAGLRGEHNPEALVDRAEALLAAGLPDAAREDIVAAAQALRGQGRETMLAEAVFRLGQCAMAVGELHIAAPCAHHCVRVFFAQRRRSWLAASLALHSLAELRGEHEQPARRSASRRAEVAEWHGWRALAAELRYTLATHHPHPTELWRSIAAAGDDSDPEAAVFGLLAQARLAEREQDGRVLAALARRGMRLAGSPAGGASVTVRARVAELVAMTTAAAASSGHPREVLRWLDRARELAAGGTGPPWAFTELACRLHGRTLLHFGVERGALVVAAVTEAGVRLHRLGPLRAARSAVDRLRLALRAGRGAEGAACALQERLLEPIGELSRASGLVIVGVPELAGVCWAELPRCRGLPVAVVPSIAAWLSAGALGAQRFPGPPIWAAGPGLAHARREVSALAARHGGTLLTGSAAGVDAVRAALDGARSAHLAAHGRTRGGLTGTELADGELSSEELDTVRRVPEIVVLSACATGASALPGALLERGARAVLASVGEVRDESVCELMLALHEQLAAGVPPATALARAQRDHGAHGFNCYGA
jgi:tetratricopeptide (TPR) repeat protein